MKTVCPTCNTSYNIPDSKIPAGKNVNATCKKCGNRFIISSPSEVDIMSGPEKEVKTPPPMESETPTPHIAEKEQPPSPSLESLFDEYPDLRNVSSTHFNLSDIFTRNKKGGYKSGQNKFKVKILNATHEILTKILSEGEKVVKIGKGVAYYPVEIFFGNGYLTMIYNHYAIACTDRRILLINTDSKMKHPTHYFFQFPYESLKKVKRGLFGRSLTLTPHKGKRRILNGIRSYLSKELNLFVQGRMKENSSAPGEESSLIDLCPSCFAPLGKGLEKCPKCRSNFKSPKTAFIRSLLLPGLGDFYLGHHVLGVLEIIGSIVVWLIVISFLLSNEPEALAGAIILLLFYNGLDGAITLHMARKGYML